MARLGILILAISLAVPLYAQSTKPYPGVDLNNTWTGNNIFQSFVGCKNIDSVRCIDNSNSAGWSGSDPGAWINAAEADLPTTGGIIDARGLTGVQSATTPIVFNKLTRLILGAVTLTGTATPDADMILVQGGATSPQGSCIVGAGKDITVLQPNELAEVSGHTTTANGIHFSATNNWNTSYCVYDLTITNSSGTRANGGSGIFADAAVSPAQNSIGFIQNVKVQNMYYGILLVRPITTVLERVDAIGSHQDGITMKGDGTTVLLNNVYSLNSGHWNFGQHGMNAVQYNNVASQGAGVKGIVIDRNDAGNQSIGTSMNGVDIEVDNGDGIYCQDCIGLDIGGVNILNVAGDGIHIDGGRDVSLRTGEIKGSGGCGLDVTQSSTPVFPANIVNQGLFLTANTGGNECGGASNSTFIAAVTTMGYDSSGLFRSSNPIVATGSPATLAGTGACGTITTQTGGAWGGSFTCTGSTGSSTITITIGASTSAPNGWNCSKASDITTTANSLVQTSVSTTQCLLSGTVNANDVIVWSAIGF